MKKTTRSIIAMLGITLMASMMVMFTACENDKGTNDTGLNENGLFDSNFDQNFDTEVDQIQELSATPSEATVDTVGEKVAFRVGGGTKPYSWSVSTSGSGTLDKSSTANSIDSVIYTVASLANNTITIKDRKGRTGIVVITANTKNITVSPSAISFLATDAGTDGANTAQTYTFSSQGGATPITWSVDKPGIATVTAAGAFSTKTGVYTSLQWSNTTVKVIVTDSAGATASATVDFD